MCILTLNVTVRLCIVTLKVTGLPQEVTVRPHTPSSSQIQWACYKKRKVERKAQTASVNGRHPSSETLVGVLPCVCRNEENDRADRQAGKAAVASGLGLRRSEVLRSLRHYLRAQGQRHHIIDRMNERGVERGSVRRAFTKERERDIVSETNIATVTSQRRGGAHMGFSEC